MADIHPQHCGVATSGVVQLLHKPDLLIDLGAIHPAVGVGPLSISSRLGRGGASLVYPGECITW